MGFYCRAVRKGLWIILYFMLSVETFYFMYRPLPPTKILVGGSGRYSDWLWVGRSRDRIPVGSRFSAPVQTGSGTHPALCTMGTGSFSGVKSGRSVTTPRPLLVPWSRKSRAIPLLPLWAVRPVQSFSACTVQLYLYSPYRPYGLYRASVPVQ